MDEGGSVQVMEGAAMIVMGKRNDGVADNRNRIKRCQEVKRQSFILAASTLSMK